ncbi:MAG: FxsA family protein [Ghiorsea sp.]|nr:FxsA family protein [Ghiorsea sp.]
MLKILLFLFVFVPLVELYVLIEVGSGIGGLATIALCLFTAAAGGIIIRIQGLQTLMQARQNMQNMRQDQLAETSAHGLMLILAGVLLFFPGLITDMFGFLLLVPAIRRSIMPKHMRFQTSTTSTGSKHHRYPEVEVIDAEVIKKD